MKCLLEAELYLKLEKCKFYKETVWYLGLVISTKGISIGDHKVHTVLIWRWEKKTKNRRWNNLFEVQQFLEFCNYYRQFIHKDSLKPEPLIRLTKKNESFVWEWEQQLAFNMMITVFTTAMALHLCDHEREAIIKCDASDYVTAGVLSQRDDERVLHSVAYFAK